MAKRSSMLAYEFEVYGDALEFQYRCRQLGIKTSQIHTDGWEDNTTDRGKHFVIRYW
jgi:hypothetical protein